MSSAQGSITLGQTTVQWDEFKNQLVVTPHAIGTRESFYMNYDSARELLDCLMLIFGRHDLTVRYPEVR